MYNDTIKVANKIISYDDLLDIFLKMQEKLLYYKKINHNEELRNKMLDYNYQTWSFKDTSSSLTFNVEFSDDTNIKFDNYDNFISIFNTRLEEIKNIFVYFNISYSTKYNEKSEWYNQHIYVFIYEDKMDIDVSLSSQDDKISDVYEYIKNKILNAPPKYDSVIKDKGKITTNTGLSIGLIPGIIITSLLLLIPAVRHLFAISYVLYPICALILSFIIGGIVSGPKLDNLYKPIRPDQKYAGYDSNKGKSIYKDDINKFVETSEILIGKNTNNLKNRKEIIEYYEKYKKSILYKLIILLILSIVVIFFRNV